MAVSLRGEGLDYLRRCFELHDGEFDVQHHYPKDFMARFRVDRERVMEARPSMLWLPLIWRPWRRTSKGLYACFWFWVVVAISRVPLHAQNLDMAQTYLGTACTVVITEFRDRPLIDDREFFVEAWCCHPWLIPSEQVIFIPNEWP